MTDHAETTVRRILGGETFRQAVATLDADHDRTVADIIRFTETEAPSFQEDNRAGAWLEEARAHRL